MMLRMISTSDFYRCNKKTKTATDDYLSKLLL